LHDTMSQILTKTVSKNSPNVELCHQEPGVKRVGERALWEKDREKRAL